MLASTRPEKSTVIRTGSNDPSFRSLVAELDTDLAIRDGDDHAFYAQFNTSDRIKHVVVVMCAGVAVGCGAFKAFKDDAVEIKRMYVPPVQRKQGIASLILHELERWAYELGHTRCVLETGVKQPEAIALYTKCGYCITPNYGPYIGVETSLCFEKHIRM